MGRPGAKPDNLSKEYGEKSDQGRYWWVTKDGKAADSRPLAAGQGGEGKMAGGQEQEWRDLLQRFGIGEVLRRRFGEFGIENACCRRSRHLAFAQNFFGGQFLAVDFFIRAVVGT